MSQPTRQYELVYIVAPTATEQELADVHGQVEGIVGRFGGTVTRWENWGRRKLAYEIQHHKDGVYVLEVLSGPGEMVRELDRRLRVTDQVIRHLIVRVDEELKVAERQRARRAAARQARRAQRQAAEAADVGTEASSEGAAAGERRGVEGVAVDPQRDETHGALEG
jgi:small subunit ribosomal protein S6